MRICRFLRILFLLGLGVATLAGSSFAQSSVGVVTQLLRESRR